MIDIHHHLLWSMDDGASNVETRVVSYTEEHNRSNAARTVRKRCSRTQATPEVEQSDDTLLIGGNRAHQERLKTDPDITPLAR